MFEFLVTLFVCGDVNQPSTCQPLGQKTAVYETKRDCGLAAFGDITEALREQGLEDKAIDTELEKIIVVCQRGNRVTAV